MASNDKKTIREMLEALDLDKAVSFKECDNIGDEFALIKRAYFKKVLVCHPDKGGDVELFVISLLYIKPSLSLFFWYFTLIGQNPTCGICLYNKTNSTTQLIAP